ncbi:hypothetical protein [Micromonospora endophytica]|uniref:hypothetical protein n=1 Tax=Micromonospora endophytica TaxID=515350 RepID=UPI0020176585|nr:hypothetical protein [Micromonospora endophytica]
MLNDPTTALRCLLEGRLGGHDRRLRRFTDVQWRRYADVLAGALLVAARRRFVAGQERAPLIRFVASARERYDLTGVDVDPTLAEALIGAALGERPAPPPSTDAVAAGTVLLLALLEDEGFTASELDLFLTAAEAAAQSREATPSVTASAEGAEEEEVAAVGEGDGEEAEQEAQHRIAGRGGGADGGTTPAVEHQPAADERGGGQAGAHPGVQGGGAYRTHP